MNKISEQYAMIISTMDESRKEREERNTYLKGPGYVLISKYSDEGKPH